VTYLAATADENKIIGEIRHENRAHGALSIAFSGGIGGAADLDGDGYVVRGELEEYVTYHVRTLSNQTQVPGFLPRGSADSDQPLLQIAGTPQSGARSAKLAGAELPVSVVGGNLPFGVRGSVEADDATLPFEIGSNEVAAFFGTDEITRFTAEQRRRASGLSAWQMVIDKFHLLEAVDAAFDGTSAPLALMFACPQGVDVDCDGRHAEGTTLSFAVDAPRSGGGEFLVLFNLAGSGELQPLYPLPEAGDPARIDRLPYRFEIDVAQPFGRDDLVAGLCRESPARLVEMLLARAETNAPASERFYKLASGYGCQWGRLALFTGG